MKHQSIITVLFILCCTGSIAQEEQERVKAINWPDGKKVAVSLSFDDARLSQVDAGIPMLNEYGVKATFYLNSAPMRERREGWKKAVEAGHEIGNHSTTHPCSGNYFWVGKGNELENLTMEQMRKNLLDCNKVLKDELGVDATLFAYPCGQKFIGRGKNLKSYVPLIAEMFASGRGWFEEMNNDPMFCDYSQLAGREMDGKTFEEIQMLIDDARAHGDWLLLAGHEMGEEGMQTTRISMLRKLIEYAKDPDNGIWLAPVGEVQNYIKKQRGN
ncbi:MAG TPA: polysaccharide deacetylase family protein [Flavitalea sp.]|nr:polysaccharide deacetylase family protein [Flavitalea sp.]